MDLHSVFFVYKLKDNSRVFEILSLFPPLVASSLAGNFQMHSCNLLALLCLIVIFESEDETLWCDFPRETSLMILSQWFTFFLEIKFRINQSRVQRKSFIQLAFTSPDVISTSPKSFSSSRIDFTLLLSFEFLKEHHLPVEQVKSRFH